MATQKMGNESMEKLEELDMGLNGENMNDVALSEKLNQLKVLVDF